MDKTHNLSSFECPVHAIHWIIASVRLPSSWKIASAIQSLHSIFTLCQLS